MKTEFTLNGVSIKRPSQFKIERYKITKSERLASGSMAMELIAKKRKFYFTYEAIDATELNKILDIIWETNDCFFTLEYVESNIRKSAVVYVGSIPTELYRTDPGAWVWSNVSFNLIEQ